MARISRNQPDRDNRSDSRKRSFDKKSGNKPRPAGRSFDKSALSRKKDGEERPRYSEKSNSERPAPRSFKKREEGGAGRYESKKRADHGTAGGKVPDQSRSKYQRKEYSDKPRTKRPFHKKSGDKQKRNPSTPITDIASGGLIRLNRYISNSGVCSRREADELIKLGVITVNGTTITTLGHKVSITDDVRHEGKRLRAQKPVYLLLNKPKGYITTTDDPEERNTVMQLIQGACKERVYPVGRLDRNTSGLLLLTNDGELTDKLTHPSHNVKKIYKVELDRPLTKNDFQKILDGVYFEEGKAQVDDLAIISEDGKTVGLELHIGWNRIVRRIFEALGYHVEKLDRSVYATLDKKDLARGQWRFLREEEVIRLKHLI